MAGICGAFNIRKLDREGEITIVTNENYPFYSRPLITDVMTGKKRAGEITLLPENEYKRYGFTLMKGVQVGKLALKERSVSTAEGRQQFDKLFIATGAVPKKIPFEGEGIFSVRTMEDAEKIRAYLPKVKQAIVFGGGPIGIKAAYALLTAGIPVNIIISSSQMLSRVLDERSSQYFRTLFEQNGARFFFNSDIKEIVRSKRGLKGVVTDKGEMVQGDMLIVGKGVSPDLDIVRDAGLRVDKGILVDDHMETNHKGVYAAGDVAQAKVITLAPRHSSASSIQHPASSIQHRASSIEHPASSIEHPASSIQYPVSSDRDVLPLWPVGAEQGKIAGQNMAGAKRAYSGGVGSNSIEYFGLKAVSMGITRDDGCEAALFEGDGVYRKFLFNEERLAGAVLLGDISDAGVLLHAIRNSLPVRNVLTSAVSRQHPASSIEHPASDSQFSTLRSQLSLEVLF